MEPTFTQSNSKKIIDEVAIGFKQHFETIGYEEVEPVPISSGIDPTVRFIGSHISVLKPYFLTNAITGPGFYIVQNCVRTHNLNRLFDDEFTPNWGSFFPSLGAIAPSSSLKKVISVAMNFFESSLGITRSQIKIRVNSNDEKLMKALTDLNHNNILEIDTYPLKYYRHTLGDEGVLGNNFNFALRNRKTGVFEDVGNIILINKDSKDLCVELALGETTIIKALFGLDHVLNCHPIEGLDTLPPSIGVKLHDTMLFCLVLYHEGLRPAGTSNRRRILRTYTRSLSYLRTKANFSLTELHDSMITLEIHEFPQNHNSVVKEIIDYLHDFESSLQGDRRQSKEERVISHVLNRE